MDLANRIMESIINNDEDMIYYHITMADISAKSHIIYELIKNNKYIIIENIILKTRAQYPSLVFNIIFYTTFITCLIQKKSEYIYTIIKNNSINIDTKLLHYYIISDNNMIMLLFLFATLKFEKKYKFNFNLQNIHNNTPLMMSLGCMAQSNIIFI
jgi:hypothetical protein